MNSIFIDDGLNQLFAQKDPSLAPEVGVYGVPAPVGGWDAISPLSDMDPKYAVILQNWVPRPGYIELRGGYSIWSAVSSVPIETLMVWRGPNAVPQLFAAAGSSIHRCTAITSNTVVVTASFTSARFQYVNFTPAGGSSYIYIVNGAEAPHLYDGTTWTTAGITGVTQANLIHINAHKRRLWFVEKNTTNMWYLATDAITGAATRFTLGQFMTKGGSLTAMGTWTVDGGNGPDDLAVFATSRGQVIIYKGTDPGNANAWALVGVFDLAIPLGRRCFGKIGSDLGFITLEGLLPISKALPFDPSGVRSTAYTNRIQNAMLQSALLGKDLFGWEIISFPGQGLVIMNVPQSENVQQTQFVMNAITGAWTNFVGWNANTFELYGDSLYFGDNNGNVCLAYTGSMDNDQAVVYDCQCAFNFFESPGRVKNMTMCRPFLLADGEVAPSLSIDVDFNNNAPGAPVTVFQPTGAVWNVAQWDVDLWSVGIIATTNWLSVNALGTALAIRIQVNLDTGSTNDSITASGLDLPFLRVNAFQAIINPGGPV